MEDFQSVIIEETENFTLRTGVMEGMLVYQIVSKEYDILESFGPVLGIMLQTMVHSEDHLTKGKEVVEKYKNRSKPKLASVHSIN